MEFASARRHRLTKIVCTLGPTCSSVDQIHAVAERGMNVARINVSHGTRDGHLALMDAVRSVNKQYGFAVALMIDTRGAEIRTGDVQDPISIKKGEDVLFVPTTFKGGSSDHPVIEVGYDGFSSDVRETDQIIMDNGDMTFDILSVNSDGSVLTRAQQKGIVGSRRHINLPGADIDLPSVTEKDWDDIAFAAEQGVDFVALSFIRDAEEVRSVRTFLDERKSTMKIVTKIEARKALERLPEIIEASDAIMVARGDLGAEVPIEQLPIIQDEIVQRCRDIGRPVIVATHMLESMTEHPIPTRAEVMDVAHAATEQTDATMLSGETASGNDPPLVVEVMDKILRATEAHIARFSERQETGIADETDARADAAVALATSSKAHAIVVFTRTGHTPLRLSRFRPTVPIITVTESAVVERSLQLVYGVFPVVIPFADAEGTVERGLLAARDRGLLSAGTRVVVVSDTQTKGEPVTSVQLRTVS